MVKTNSSNNVSKGANRLRRYRKNQTNDQRNKRLLSNTLRRKEILRNENVSKKKIRLKIDRERKSRKRACTSKPHLFMQKKKKKKNVSN